MNFDMNPINFIKVEEKTHYEYHLPLMPQVGFVDRDILDGTFLSMSSYENLIAYLNSLGISMYLDASSLLYTTFIELLAKNKSTLVIGKFLKKIHETINPIECMWNYTLEYTYEDEPNLCRKFGFLTYMEFIKEVNYSNKTLRAYEYANIEEKYLCRFINSFHNDVSNWSFAIGINHEEELKRLLKDKYKRPDISEILKTCDMLVSVQVGVDEGYNSYILIQSKEDISHSIKNIENKVITFLERFEYLIDKFDKIEDVDKEELFKNELMSLKKEYVHYNA